MSKISIERMTKIVRFIRRRSSVSMAFLNEELRFIHCQPLSLLKGPVHPSSKPAGRPPSKGRQCKPGSKNAGLP